MATFRNRTKNVQKRLRELRTGLGAIPQKAHKEFVSVTPKDTGNARRKTDLKGTEIQGNYPYSVRLEKGWSKQAPNGMSDQTIDFIRAEIRKI